MEAARSAIVLDIQVCGNTAKRVFLNSSYCVRYEYISQILATLERRLGNRIDIVDLFLITYSINISCLPRLFVNVFNIVERRLFVIQFRLDIRSCGVVVYEFIYDSSILIACNQDISVIAGSYYVFNVIRNRSSTASRAN